MKKKILSANGITETGKKNYPNRLANQRLRRYDSSILRIEDGKVRAQDFRELDRVNKLLADKKKKREAPKSYAKRVDEALHRQSFVGMSDKAAEAMA